jgi:hypothetical protein
MVDNSFDLSLFKAKNHIDDAVGMAKRGQQPMQPMPQQMPMQQGQMPMQQGQMPMQQGQMPMQQPMQQGQMPTQQPMQQQGQFAVAPQGQMPMQSRQFAKGGLAMAEGGGAWTRKEGKDPSGGLNAKGRASLKAQGQDIKPPVSAKQAKNSPKSAARRKSFCARMSGMPGPMKDEGGKPTRKALALRKWDCKAKGGVVEGYAEGGKSRVNEAGNYTKPGMRKSLFNSIKSGSSGGAPGQWSARKAQMLAKQYKARGGGYK